jgi:hypothetical protein
MLLAACGTLRVAYGTAPQLTWWWLDGYADFTGEQSGDVRRAIDEWFEWQRASQLAGHADLLVDIAGQAMAPVSPQQVCRWQSRLLDRAAPAIDRALVQAAAIVPRLSEAQLRHMEQRFAKANAELREDFAQPDPAARQAAAVKRQTERFERIYGRLDEPQRRVVAAAVAASPFDAERWFAERERRQRETLSVLRRLQAERADADQRVAALRALVEHFERSPDPAYRSYRERLASHQCATFAQLHNAATTAQRQTARDRLLGWAADLRAIASAQP